MTTERSESAATPTRPFRSGRRPPIAGVTLSSRVRAGLRSEPTDLASLHRSLLTLARRLSSATKPSAAATIDDLVTLGRDALNRDAPIHGAFVLRLYTECFAYFDRVGRHEARMDLAREVLASVERLPNAWTRRGAHHFVAVAHLKADDAKGAWAHAERAYALSSGYESAAGRLEILVLAVQILDSLGLLVEAHELALQLAAFPDGEPPLDTLHLVNALNGLSICHRLNDLEAASHFHALARGRATLRLRTQVPALVVRFEAAQALHLSRLGRNRSAVRVLDQAVARKALDPETVEGLLLRCAQAEVHAALDDDVRIEASLATLKGLLPAVSCASGFRQELLRAIIGLQLRRDASDDRAVTVQYLQQLRDLPGVTIGASLATIDFPLRGLSYRTRDGFWDGTSDREPPPLRDIGSTEWAAEQYRHRCFADFGFALPESTDELVVLSPPEREADLRSDAYAVAEDWAVAAEIAVGGDGRRCFKVGRIASALAAALGFSEQRSVLVELACRLRNVGDATLARPRDLAARSRAGSADALLAPASAGARILSFSSDPLLRLATRVAAHHQAWWNGAGLATGLRGDAIPVEARICAVADGLVGLVDPIGVQKPWPIEKALRQIRCMAGLQFDPVMVDVLGRVLQAEGIAIGDSELRLASTLANDPFVKARKQLFETLELAA